MNKWNNPDIPHKAWECVNVYDAGIDYEICQMCGNERVRYVHVMKHMEYPNALNVGCICAENMSEDYVGPKRREKELQNRAKRRQKWLIRTWRVSSKGNDFLNVDGHNVVIFPDKFRRWLYRIDKQISAKRFITKDQAKLAAFDELWPAPKISQTVSLKF